MFWKIIGTSFGSGYSPFAPGTMGALVGLLLLLPFCETPPFAPLATLSIPFFFVIILIFFFLGVVATNQLEAEWGHDPQKIVMDETVGFWLTVFLFPLSLSNLLIGFILFRVFDIWKPLGIRKMEALKGGWGVMMDDVLAGVYAGICLFGINYFLF